MMPEKWIWMMNYCKDNSIPPAQSWAWERAEREYIDNDLIDKK